MFEFVLLRHVATKYAAGGRANQRMVMGVMTGYRTDDGPFNTALGIGRSGRERDCRRESQTAQNRFHRCDLHTLAVPRQRRSAYFFALG